MASISGSVMGDEYTDVYFFCPVCDQYTVAQWRDNFTGTETLNVAGPVPKQTAEKQIELIAQCVQPWKKKCRCEAHRKYFNNLLD